MANIRHNLVIKSSQQKVYDAITTEKGLKGWWTDKTTAKPEEGFINHFIFSGENFNKMKIIKLNPSSEVQWECVDGDKEWIGTKVSFVIEERETDVVLKFSHNNWDNESEFFGFCSYHWGRFMDSIKSLCETGTGKPYQG